MMEANRSVLRATPWVPLRDSSTNPPMIVTVLKQKICTAVAAIMPIVEEQIE
jgi:hypothetical protein